MSKESIPNSDNIVDDDKTGSDMRPSVTSSGSTAINSTEVASSASGLRRKSKAATDLRGSKALNLAPSDLAAIEKANLILDLQPNRGVDLEKHLATTKAVSREMYSTVEKTEREVANTASALLASLQAMSPMVAKVESEASRGATALAASLPLISVPSVEVNGLLEALGVLSKVPLPKITLPNMELSNLAEAMAGASSVAMSPQVLQKLSKTLRKINGSLSVPSFYSSAELEDRSRDLAIAPRRGKTPGAFFDELAVEVTSVDSFLKAITIIQRKHHLHQLVWRGQSNAEWPVHSSLFRTLKTEGPLLEDDLVCAESRTIELAEKWGQDSSNPLKLLADLQHYGAPTRLLDVTTDPEVAAWFATESSQEYDEYGRIVAWGRAVRVSPRKFSPQHGAVNNSGGALFWHLFATDQTRSTVDWGTGTRTWSWFPPTALSERMRAQRAGFLLDAGPLVTPKVAAVISDSVSDSWSVAEITNATSVLGIPSRHDIQTKPNDGNLVPIFSLRVSPQCKRELREYLSGKGLESWTVYPDRNGLVEYLKGPFGVQSNTENGKVE